LTLHPGLPEHTARIIAGMLRRSLESTLKNTASLRLQPPLTLGDLERRLETTLAYYLCFRPHQGLRGATPAEALLGVEPACRGAKSPPRGRLGEGGADLSFTVGFLDRDRRALPVLLAAA
jgi:hypothetical protein